MEKQLEFSLEKNFYLEAFNNGPNGFPLGNQTRIYLRNNHLQYALTWLMLALSLVGVYFFASIKKK
jgi:surfeit locus 1 family protein